MKEATTTLQGGMQSVSLRRLQKFGDPQSHLSHSSST